MNEKFAELAAQVPELVEAIASGKRPTKGEIVKASIARHQAQDRLIQELQLELQALRTSNDLQGITAQQGLAASMPAITVDVSQQQQQEQEQAYTMPYQIQPSRPLLQTSEEGSIWLGQLFGKSSDELDRSPSFQPTYVSAASVANISPFKSSSFMSCWSYPTLESYSLDLGPALLEKSRITESSLDQLSRCSSISTFPSPAFTSSDTDSASSSDLLDPALEDPTYLAENLTDHLAFEPFVLTDDAVEETPLSALLDLPSTDPVEQNSSSADKDSTTSTSNPSHYPAKEDRSSTAMTPDSPHATAT